jgi:hypothetical protein
MFTPMRSLLCRWPSRFTSGQWRTWGGGLALLFLSALALPAEVSREYQIKAAFLFNFTKFVEWPPDRFGDDTSPIIIGVIGKTPVGDELRKIVKDRLVNRRAIVVKLITTADEAPTVHLLFVSAGEETRPPAAAWQKAAVVAVGESEKFSDLGGTITFTREADKVRFEINIATAERDGLKISAQLQKLATAVYRRP